MKILIWGGCGHGKTTLAKSLSKITGIKTYDLDEVTKKRNSQNQLTPESLSDKERDNNLKNVLKNKQWIIDGAYIGDWMHNVIKDANKIIIIKINPIKAQFRVLKRYVKRKLTKKPERTAGSINDLTRLMTYARIYHKDYFQRQLELSKQFNKPIIILQNNNEIKTFLSTIK